jgi:hypothetical protein
MGLGERCDEIVRLIDETLADLGVDPADAATAGPGSAATVTALAPRAGSKADRRQRQPLGGPRPDRTDRTDRPDRTAAGF